MFDLTGKRVWVAGHRGMVGSALVRRLDQENCETVTVAREALDLRDQAAVLDWMRDARIDVVFLAAGKVGGILANDRYPVDFLLDNLLIETAVIGGAHAADVRKLVFLGSSCIYPKLAPQPIVESALLTGPLEPTNEWYAVAKIAGVKLVQAFRKQHGRDFISVMPANLYGPGDNFDLASSHAVPALIRKVHEAKLAGTPVVVWGTGTPRRELLFVDDCADACVHLCRTYSDAAPVNVGTGEDKTILELTMLIMDVLGHSGEILHDLTRPDGTQNKRMDVSKLATLGWKAKTGLREGIARSYAAFLQSDRRGQEARDAAPSPSRG
jgi:GDP-L-fucose synthase